MRLNAAHRSYSFKSGTWFDVIINQYWCEQFFNQLLTPFAAVSVMRIAWFGRALYDP